MIAGTSEREFHAPVAGGEIVGWVRGIGPPALLLHGGPGLSEYLTELALELSEVMTVARYQQRGLAPSVAEGDRSVDGHVADAVAGGRSAQGTASMDRPPRGRSAHAGRPGWNSKFV